uniref:Uncharacterized protein n=1 Tax=Anguilla anguilla TaxID=7936 RepID=A0A0E9UK36_ANGAN
MRRQLRGFKGNKGWVRDRLGVLAQGVN